MLHAGQDSSVESAMTVYPATDAGVTPRPAVLVLPAGGYREHATAQDLPGLRNTLEGGRAIATAGRRVQVNLYPDGPHGVGLADGRGGYPNLPHTARWTHDCEAWLRHENFL